MMYILILLMFLPVEARSQNFSGPRQLYKAIFADYDAQIRPGINETKTDIGIMITPIYLIDLDEMSQVLSMEAMFAVGWNDDRCTWDKDKEVLDNIHVHQENIWLPSMEITNGMGVTNDENGRDKNVIKLIHTGTITWIFRKTVIILCDIDITLYPFDTQMCEIVLDFVPYTTDDLGVGPFSHKTPIDLKYFNVGGKWTLERDACLFVTRTTPYNKSYNLMTYRFYFRRRNRFYLMHIVLPVMFLSLTSSSVFLLPVASGEKMGVAMTVLLAYSVYL